MQTGLLGEQHPWWAIYDDEAYCRISTELVCSLKDLGHLHEIAITLNDLMCASSDMVKKMGWIDWYISLWLRTLMPLDTVGLLLGCVFPDLEALWGGEWLGIVMRGLQFAWNLGKWWLSLVSFGFFTSISFL